MKATYRYTWPNTRACLSQCFVDFKSASITVVSFSNETNSKAYSGTWTDKVELLVCLAAFRYGTVSTIETCPVFEQMDESELLVVDSECRLVCMTTRFPNAV